MTSRSKCQPNLQESVKRETWLSLDFCGRWRLGRKLDRQISEGRFRSLCSLKFRAEFLEGHRKPGLTSHLITCYHQPCWGWEKRRWGVGWRFTLGQQLLAQAVVRVGLVRRMLHPSL